MATPLDVISVWCNEGKEWIIRTDKQIRLWIDWAVIRDPKTNEVVAKKMWTDEKVVKIFGQIGEYWFGVDTSWLKKKTDMLPDIYLTSLWWKLNDIRITYDRCGWKLIGPNGLKQRFPLKEFELLNGKVQPTLNKIVRWYSWTFANK